MPTTEEALKRLDAYFGRHSLAIDYLRQAPELVGFRTWAELRPTVVYASLDLRDGAVTAVSRLGARYLAWSALSLETFEADTILNRGHICDEDGLFSTEEAAAAFADETNLVAPSLWVESPTGSMELVSLPVLDVNDVDDQEVLAGWWRVAHHILGKERADVLRPATRYVYVIREEEQRFGAIFYLQWGGKAWEAVYLARQSGIDPRSGRVGNDNWLTPWACIQGLGAFIEELALAGQEEVT